MTRKYTSRLRVYDLLKRPWGCYDEFIAHAVATSSKRALDDYVKHKGLVGSQLQGLRAERATFETSGAIDDPEKGFVRTTFVMSNILIHDFAGQRWRGVLRKDGLYELTKEFKNE